MSSKRHSLSARSLSRGMAVAFYSKNGMIEEGMLAKWKDDIQTEKKGKRKAIVVED